MRIEWAGAGLVRACGPARCGNIGQPRKLPLIALPLQEAGVHALRLPRSYYDHLQADYTVRRNRLLPVLKDAGFRCFDPDGAYYVMTDISAFGYKDDVEFSRFLVKDMASQWCRAAASNMSLRLAGLR